MFDVYRRDYPHNEFLWRADTEEEAKEACKWFDGATFYIEVTREQINHEANIFANSL